jgi:SAM-dependent methyltransferase
LKLIVEWLAAQPLLFDMLRWILEAGYGGEKNILKKECSRGSGKVLDLGCGTGVLAGVFDSDSYVGVDPNPSYIERARKKKRGHHFLIMDGRCLKFETGLFDTVIISGVLHHLADADAEKILAEVKRVLKPETGKLVMWEDVACRSAFNLIGRLVHGLDEGDHIRAEDHYLKLIRSYFEDVRHYPMSSGVCDYIVMVAR